eukprot:scaffold11034_cov155-Skeletonema_dohrnii-CCMP3373.AAC.11
MIHTKTKTCYAIGKVSKADFAAALRAHQAAVDARTGDAMKRPQREAVNQTALVYSSSSTSLPTHLKNHACDKT